MSEHTASIAEDKAALIERAIKQYGLKSIVDLGACWGVHGGYTWHALEKGRLDRAVIVDGHITETTRERARKWPQAELISGGLAAEDTVAKVGAVDAAIMYDVLLHQVDPDWTTMLERWSRQVDTLIIHNQNWLGPETVRFPDFGAEEYIERVFHSDPERVRSWYGRHDEMNEDEGKRWRDVHFFWQWGITQKDLVGTLWDLGYRVDFMEEAGLFADKFSEFDAVSLIARKRELPLEVRRPKPLDEKAKQPAAAAATAQRRPEITSREAAALLARRGARAGRRVVGRAVRAVRKRLK
jgi:hypothetical protein